jgi:hypothetical protein
VEHGSHLGDSCTRGIEGVEKHGVSSGVGPQFDTGSTESQKNRAETRGMGRRGFLAALAGLFGAPVVRPLGALLPAPVEALTPYSDTITIDQSRGLRKGELGRLDRVRLHLNHPKAVALFSAALAAETGRRSYFSDRVDG